MKKVKRVAKKPKVGNRETGIVPQADIARWHKVFYTIHQIERTIRVKEFAVGMMVGIVEQRGSNLLVEGITAPVFYVAKVVSIGHEDDPIIGCEYVKHPWSIGISMGANALSRYAIRYPVPDFSRPLTTREKG